MTFPTADSSGNNNHGIDINGPSFSSSDGGQFDGQSTVKFAQGKSLSLGGAGTWDYVNCGNSSSLRELGAQSITLEGWFYSADWKIQPNWSRLVGKFYQGGVPEQRAGFTFMVFGDKSVHFVLFESDGATWWDKDVNFGIMTNYNKQWVHLAGVYNHAEGKSYAYRNGVLVAQQGGGAANWVAATNNNFRIVMG